MMLASIGGGGGCLLPVLPVLLVASTLLPPELSGEAWACGGHGGRDLWHPSSEHPPKMSALAPGEGACVPADSLCGWRSEAVSPQYAKGAQLHRSPSGAKDVVLILSPRLDAVWARWGRRNRGLALGGSAVPSPQEAAQAGFGGAVGSGRGVPPCRRGGVGLEPARGSFPHTTPLLSGQM